MASHIAPCLALPIWAAGGSGNPHLTTISVNTNPGGVVNKSSASNPNAETTTITYKTTGKSA